MLVIEMPQKEIYELSIKTFIRPVLTFDITKSIAETWKLALVYCKTWTPLVLCNYKVYMSVAKILQKILPIPIQTAINLASLGLASSTQASNNFNSILVNPSKSWFVASKGLSNTNYTCWHAQTIIALNNAFDSCLGLHWLDFFAFLVLSITTIDEITIHYLYLSLKQADDFHQMSMEYKIYWLDFIIAQMAN